MDTTYDSVIEQIAQSIFSTMLNIDLVRVEAPGPADQETLLAAVQISGQWMGSAVLALSPALARESAAAMMHLSSQEVTAIDQQEVAAELVNMIGGNLKSLLPGPSYLSLPTIIAGQEFDLHVHRAELLDEVVLRSESGFARVRLYARIPPLAT